MKSIGYFTHSDCVIHDMGHMHPENHMRLQAIDTRLQADGLMLDLYEALPVEHEWIEPAHLHKYVHDIKNRLYRKQ
jgi:acetoin utilization deacetylase AcuC-like enzyme